MEDRTKNNLENTQFFRVQPEPVNGVQKILSVVYEALSEKGYDPVSQIVGYIMSGDPTYVTNWSKRLCGAIYSVTIGRNDQALTGTCQHSEDD